MTGGSDDGHAPQRTRPGHIVGRPLHALSLSGLSLTAGVMRFINVAHGDFIVLAGYALLTLATAFGLSPVAATIVVLPVAFAVGQRICSALSEATPRRQERPARHSRDVRPRHHHRKRSVGSFRRANTRKLSGGWYEGATISLGAGVQRGCFLGDDLGVAAILVVAGLDLLLYRTGVGAKIRAVSDDVAAADLIGLSSANIYAVAMGISFVTIAVAAAFMSIWSNFDPSSGPARLLVAFEVIVLGGLGSMWGSARRGCRPRRRADSRASIRYRFGRVLAGHIVFLLVLAIFDPKCLFSKIARWSGDAFGITLRVSRRVSLRFRGSACRTRVGSGLSQR